MKRDDDYSDQGVEYVNSTKKLERMAKHASELIGVDFEDLLNNDDS